MVEEVKLKPCPFCGGEAEVFSIGGSSAGDTQDWLLRHDSEYSDCPADRGVNWGRFRSRNSAVNSWNTRADPTPSIAKDGTTGEGYDRLTVKDIDYIPWSKAVASTMDLNKQLAAANAEIERLKGELREAADFSHKQTADWKERDDAVATLLMQLKALNAVLTKCEKAFAYCEVRFAELEDNEAALYCTSVHAAIAGLKEKT